MLDWHDWLPLPAEPDLPVVINIQGATVVLPFEPIDAAGSTYVVRRQLLDHGGLSVLGDVRQQRLSAGDFTMTVASPGLTGVDYARWVDVVARTAIRTHGAAPGRHALVVVIPVEARRSVVPWAHVRRGGGSHIIAYVDRDADVDALLADWTLYHEFAHLYHPYLRGRDRWLSEGLASYLQYVYQVRAGTISTERAAERLHAGLERGRRENVRDGRVTVASGGRMRTYWTGAALALEIDAALRERNAGPRTLARLMGDFATREIPAEKSWSAARYMEALAEPGGEDVLLSRFREVARSREFPDPGVSAVAVPKLLSGD